MDRLDRLSVFVRRFSALVDSAGNSEETLLAEGARLLQDLVRHDDWLPRIYAAASSESYRQYLLYCDPLERFSVVSFVWGPGQRTPIHDHTVWGLIGVLRGKELCEEYKFTAVGSPLRPQGHHLVLPGMVDKVSPTVGDVHRVSNAEPNGSSISIHVYGANIGTVRRHVFDVNTGAVREFVSGYDNEPSADRTSRIDETSGRTNA